MESQTQQKALCVAVIGSGPAGLYTTAELLKRFPAIRVDIFEKLASPFGLIRYGVSPDHTHTRRVAERLAPILADPRVRFFGNVDVSVDVRIEQLRPFYHALVIASGAARDRSLSIPGVELPGCYTSLEFIGWINAHPEFVDRPIPLGADTAVIIGNGNVALDVVRLLLKAPDDLSNTDINPSALEALRHSQIRNIHIVGRRGPAQTSFRPAELQEVADLTGCSFALPTGDLELNRASQAELSDGSAHSKSQQHIMDILHDIAATQTRELPHSLSFHFRQSLGAIEGNGIVEQAVIAKARLTGPAGAQIPELTGEIYRRPCGLIIQCIGHQGAPIAGVPFNEHHGTIPCHEGRVMSTGEPEPGLYAAGWIERGATGLIGHNKRDAKSVVDSISKDQEELAPPTRVRVETLLHSLGIEPNAYDPTAGRASA